MADGVEVLDFGCGDGRYLQPRSQRFRFMLMCALIEETALVEAVSARCRGLGDCWPFTEAEDRDDFGP